MSSFLGIKSGVARGTHDLSTQTLTGFEDPANVVETYNSTNRTITLTHASGFINFWVQGTRHSLTSPQVSPAHSATTSNVYWLTYDSTGNLVWNAANIFPGFNNALVAHVNYGSTDKYATRECHGTEPWQAHENEHNTVGTYRKSGGFVTAGSYTLDTNTVDAVTPAVDLAIIADEDLDTTIAALTNGSTYTRLHFDTGNAVFTLGSTFPFPDNGTNIQYNQNPIAGTALTAITANSTWMNVYCILTPATADAGSQAYRMMWMTGQSTYASVALAQAEDFRSLYTGNLTSIFPEFLPFIRITYRRIVSNLTRNAQINAVPSYLTGGKQNLTSVTGFTPTAHGTLTGRSDTDQHPASAITNTPSGNVTSTDLQSAINELQTHINSKPSYTTWQDYSPNLAKWLGSGTLTSANVVHARYAVIDNVCHVSVYINQITVATSYTALLCQLPVTPLRANFIPVYGNINGDSLAFGNLIGTAGNTTVNINGIMYPVASNGELGFNLTYEI